MLLSRALKINCSARISSLYRVGRLIVSRISQLVVASYLFLFSALVAPPAIAENIYYNIPKREPSLMDLYPIELLTLALEKSKAQYGDFKLVPLFSDMTRARTSTLVASGRGLDITWRMTSQQLESELKAIYIPLLKGMMGYRIFIIRNHDSNLFPADISLEQLRLNLAGQGIGWPDTDILRFNGFGVIEGHYANLLDMLAKRRFDYFPRAIHEPWVEIDGDNRFRVEDKILLRYPAAMFYFVKSDNEELHARIENGLNQMIKSGEFEQFFLTHPLTAGLEEKVKPHQRRVFELRNPIISNKAEEVILQQPLWQTK